MIFENFLWAQNFYGKLLKVRIDSVTLEADKNAKILHFHKRN